MKTAFSGAFPGGGAMIFIGTEVGSLFKTGSLVPGGRSIGPVRWVAGRSNQQLARDGGRFDRERAVVRAGSPGGCERADHEVFGGALPPRETLRITDTVGVGNRAFTFPRYDGKTVLNLRPDGFMALYDGAIGTTPSKYLQHTFIHELVHACQIAHSHNLSYLTSALAASGGYDCSGRPAGVFEFQLQTTAQIVSDWWLGRGAGHEPHVGGPTTMAKIRTVRIFATFSTRDSAGSGGKTGRCRPRPTGAPGFRLTATKNSLRAAFWVYAHGIHRHRSGEAGRRGTPWATSTAPANSTPAPLPLVGRPNLP